MLARRPLFCACIGFLLMQMVGVLMPQVVLMPLAAFCVLVLLALAVKREKSRPFVLGLAAIIALGVCSGTAAKGTRNAVSEQWEEQEVFLRAVVLEGGKTYLEGYQSAVLQVELLDGEPQKLKIKTSVLPLYAPGTVLEGRFALHTLPNSAYSYGDCADGVFLSGELIGNAQEVGVRRGIRFGLKALGLRLSDEIRRYISPQEAGIIAAMSTGDRRFLTEAVTAKYRRAGVSHLLVVSGLHVALLCSAVPKRRRTARQRVASALVRSILALFMMGIAGLGPSVVRAGLTLLLLQGALVLLQPGDGLTALGLAGVLMTAGNAYAVMSVSFQLSFLATFGILAGSAAADRLLREEKDILRQFPPRRKAQPAKTKAQRLLAWLVRQLCTAAGAMLFTFPVLVFWGMNVSLAALVSNLFVFCFAGAAVGLGLLTGVCGLMPLLYGFQRAFGLLAYLLARGMTFGVGLLAKLPGSQLHFETPYAGVVLVTLAVCGYGLYLLQCSLKRIALCLAGVMAVSVCIGVGTSRHLMRAALVGNGWIPAAVLTQDGHAAVLFRGGAYNAAEILEYLEQRNIEAIDLVVDLRNSTRACPLPAKEIVELDRQPIDRAVVLDWQENEIVLAYFGEGGVVRVDMGGYFVTVTSGSMDVPVLMPMDFLLASSSRNGPVRPDVVLCTSKKLRWLDSSGAKEVYYGKTGLELVVRPGKSYRVVGAEEHYGLFE